MLVVGTPYHAEFLYKLVAFSMGFDFNEDAEMKYQLVSYNGHRCWLTTHDDENLRAVHFWMIESELEQAVGRARLRTDKFKEKIHQYYPTLNFENIISTLATQSALKLKPSEKRYTNQIYGMNGIRFYAIWLNKLQ